MSDPMRGRRRLPGQKLKRTQLSRPLPCSAFLLLPSHGLEAYRRGAPKKAWQPMVLPNLGAQHGWACPRVKRVRKQAARREKKMSQFLEQGFVFFPLFFFPGLEIIGLQSEIRREGNDQKRNQFEQKRVAQRQTPPPRSTPLPQPCSHQELLLTRGLHAGRCGNIAGHQPKEGRDNRSWLGTHRPLGCASQTTPL